MKLNTTPYIVQELLDKGYITDDNKDKVAEIIAGEGKLNKEYQIKSKILSYLNTFAKGLVKEVDVNSVYSDINAKFKDPTILEDEEIKYQVLSYLKKEKKLHDYTDCSGYVNLSNLVDEIFRPFQVVGYRKIL